MRAARGGERLEPKPGENARRTRVPGVRDNEAALVQGAEGLRLIGHLYRIGGAYIRPPWFHWRFRPRSKPSGFRLASKLSP